MKNIPQLPSFLFFVLTGFLTIFIAVRQQHSANEGAGRTSRKDRVTVLQQEDWKIMADTMVENQLRAKGIKDERILSAMRSIPRHVFVPAPLRANAYEDRPLPIGHEQTISQPYMVALMTELLHPEAGDTVLEIGTGSGYQAAVLSRVAAHVFSIELVQPLADSAASRFRQLGYHNITAKSGDGYKGWKEHAPFDAIIITAAPPKIPKELVRQLKEGGKMVVPVGGREEQVLQVIRKRKNKIVVEKNIKVRFVPMRHEKR